MPLHIERIKKGLDIEGPVTMADVYLGHQQGVSGYNEISRFKNRKISDIKSSDRKRAILRNMLPVTTKRGKKATIGDFINDWKKHYNKTRKSFE